MAATGEDDLDPARDAEDSERYLVVNGRRWRRQDPSLPDEVAADLRSHLGRGRSAVGVAKRAGKDPKEHRNRVNLAKHGLGERGPAWWDQSPSERQARWEQALSELRNLDASAD